MSGDCRLRDRDVAILGSRPDALKELAACGLALSRWREEDRKPHQILRVVDGPEQRCDAWVELVHALAAARARAGEKQPSHERGSIDGDLLRDKPAHREAKQIHVLETESVDQGGGVPRHSHDGLRCRTGAESTTAGV